LHPALFAYGCLAILFPGIVLPAEIPLAGTAEDVFLLALTGTGTTLGDVSRLAVLLGGLILIRRRIFAWQMPAVFLMVTAFLSFCMGWNPVYDLVAGQTVLVAFFFLTDPQTSPTSAKGRLCFSGAAALLSFVLRLVLVSPLAEACAILTLNIVSPWMDHLASKRALML
jgi:Na+-translocating ferredoxin:NAD+ oxidoreductase subunit D